jgi:uncharacterized oligopeptide transporter (OPT) family protein
MIVDYKLTYPSGTATAYLINGFHTPEGAKLAKYVPLGSCFGYFNLAKTISIIFHHPVHVVQLHLQ